MSKMSSFWQHKRCLVTGGIGFIGSHLSKSLQEAGASVVVADKEAAQDGTLFWLLNQGRDIPVVQTDLSNRESVERIAELKVDIVFHLAASPYAPYTTLHPGEAYRSNVVTTVNMLEAARLSKAQRFVLASSACVFGASQHSPLRVDDQPYKPEHYYSVTKQDAERQVLAYHDWYQMQASVCRFGNVYGPGDRHVGRIVPQICKQLIENGQDGLELKRSTGSSVFEFLFVDDSVRGLMQAAEYDAEGLQTFQFSAGKKGRSEIIGLAENISKKFDGQRRTIRATSHVPEKRVEKYLDTRDTERLLGWSANWDLDQGLQATVDWYKEHIKSLKPHDE